MRKLIVANWKMYLTLGQSIALTKGITNYQLPITKLKIVLCPSFTALEEVAKLIKHSQIKLGAQDVEPIRRGARTGEIGIDNLRELGVKYVLVGHSEKRRYQKETNELVNQKLKAALGAGITPILCVGEPLSARKTGRAKWYVEDQLSRGLKGVTKKDIKHIVIAYEPVWAIGAKQPDTIEDAVDMHKWIRNKINVPIIYGGSVDGKNAGKFLKEKEVDGLLIGRASTSASGLRAILSGV